jgi:hypothetical protein
LHWAAGKLVDRLRAGQFPALHAAGLAPIRTAVQAIATAGQMLALQEHQQSVSALAAAAASAAVPLPPPALPPSSPPGPAAAAAAAARVGAFTAAFRDANHGRALLSLRMLPALSAAEVAAVAAAAQAHAVADAAGERGESMLTTPGGFGLAMRVSAGSRHARVGAAAAARLREGYVPALTAVGAAAAGVAAIAAAHCCSYVEKDEGSGGGGGGEGEGDGEGGDGDGGDGRRGALSCAVVPLPVTVSKGGRELAALRLFLVRLPFLPASDPRALAAAALTAASYPAGGGGGRGGAAGGGAGDRGSAGDGDEAGGAGRSGRGGRRPSSARPAPPPR